MWPLGPWGRVHIDLNSVRTGMNTADTDLLIADLWSRKNGVQSTFLSHADMYNHYDQYCNILIGNYEECLSCGVLCSRQIHYLIWSHRISVQHAHQLISAWVSKYWRSPELTSPYKFWICWLLSFSKEPSEKSCVFSRLLVTAPFAFCVTS